MFLELAAVVVLNWSCYFNPSWVDQHTLNWDTYPAQDNIELCVQMDRGDHYSWDEDWSQLDCVPSDRVSYYINDHELFDYGLIRMRIVAVKTVIPEGCENVYCYEYLVSGPSNEVCAGARIQYFLLDE